MLLQSQDKGDLREAGCLLRGHLDDVDLLVANGVSINERVITSKPSQLSSEEGADYSLAPGSWEW